MNRFAKLLAAGAGMAGASYAAYVATTWLRYGRARPAREDARDALLDEVMPVYEVCERHHIRIDAPPAATLAAAAEVDLQHSRMIRGIFRARELLLRGRAGVTRPPIGLLDELRSLGWGVIAEQPGREIILGAATRPWEVEPTFRTIPAAEFASFAEPDHVKIAVTFRVDATDDGGSIFRTETRAVATDAAARRKFRWYWSFLSPGIILIRTAMLSGLASAADRRWQLEGDDIVPDPRAQLTHAVAIAAPPADVWPWLVQIGGQRAGWYSWDILDNAGKRSADRIVPELQHIAPGDVLPWRPHGPEGFTVERVIPERALVLGSRATGWLGTWAFVLEPVGAGRTRLITRYRAAYPPSVDKAVRVPLLAAVHAFMESKQLRTIKHHAERRHAAAEPALVS